MQVRESRQHHGKEGTEPDDSGIRRHLEVEAVASAIALEIPETKTIGVFL